MIDLLLKLLGVQVSDAVRVTGAEFHLRRLDSLGWVVLFGLILVGLAWWTYRQAPDVVPRKRRLTLTALRIALLVLLLFVLLRPIVAFSIEGTIRRVLVVLADTSSSMKIEDPRRDEKDVKRAAIGRGLIRADKGLEASLGEKDANSVRQIARIDLLKAVLHNQDLHLLSTLREQYDVEPFAFGKSANEIAPAGEPGNSKATGQPNDWVAQLEAKDPSTALGDAIREVIARKRGQPMAGILVMTDGASNAGTQPEGAAIVAQTEGVPLFIYGIGITSPRDIIVGNLFTPEVAFVEDKVPVTVRVRGQGLKGEKAKLILKLGEEKVGEKEVAFEGDEEQTVALDFTAQKPGDLQLTASIEAREDETVKDNNTASRRLRVVDDKIKVLLVESAPRWEWRFLQASLLRDRRVSLKCVLLEGDPGITRGQDTPYLSGIPAKKEELFKFDVIILGDVESKVVPQMDDLSEFVSKFGGSLVLMAGRRVGPETFKDTPVEKMLPVEIDKPAAGRVATSAEDKPIPLELTSAGRADRMLQLSDRPEENSSIWSSFPPVFWTARVGRAKPAAAVLVEDPDPLKATRSGKMPVLAIQQYGMGQVLYLGTDNLWRWRKARTEQYYETLWSQIIQRMALPHLLGGSKRTQLSADKENYISGERVTVYARLYSEAYEPFTEPEVKGTFTVRDEKGQESGKGDVTLRRLPDQPGMYRGDFVALNPGRYNFKVASDPETGLDLTVTEPAFEFGETAMNQTLLKTMADQSGGQFFREEDLYKLPETIGEKSEKVYSTVEADLWSSPFYFALLLTVASLEWGLRKKSQLK